jgi:hypothetical protein
MNTIPQLQVQQIMQIIIQMSDGRALHLGMFATVVFCCAVQAKCFITRDKRERTHPDQHLERGRILNIP